MPLQDRVLAEGSAQGLADLERQLDAIIRRLPADANKDIRIRLEVSPNGLRHLREAIRVALQVAASGNRV